VPTQNPPPEITQLRPGLWIWHAFDPSVKTELFATAFAAGGGIYLVDPIPLPEAEFQELTDAGPIKGVIITNMNHERAASDYARRFSAPIFAHPNAAAKVERGPAGDLASLGSETDFEVVEIEGAVAGEIALYLSVDGGTMIVGDALINFEPYGFTFLPRKYCLDQKQMRRSLRRLCSFSFKRLLFAHGTPILPGASDRLRQLLESDS